MGEYWKTKFMSKVNTAKNLRNWAEMPADFQRAAVKFRYDEMKGYFGKKEISQRIAASRAVTFDELLNALEKCS